MSLLIVLFFNRRCSTWRRGSVISCCTSWKHSSRSHNGTVAFTTNTAEGATSTAGGTVSGNHRSESWVSCSSATTYTGGSKDDVQTWKYFHFIVLNVWALKSYFVIYCFLNCLYNSPTVVLFCFVKQTNILIFRWRHVSTCQCDKNQDAFLRETLKFNHL